MQGNLDPVDNAPPRIRVGNECRTTHAEPLNQSLVREEIKCLIALNGPAQRRTKLVSLERWYRLVFRIKKISCVQGRIAKEFESRSVDGIFARPRHRIDLAAGRSTEFCRIRVRQNLKFEYGIHAKQHAGRGTGRFVVDIVNVGPIEQEIVLLRARAVDGNFRGAPANDVITCSQGGVHPGLQKRKLLERSSVQWKVTNLFIIDETAKGSGGEIDRIRVGYNFNSVSNLPDLQFDVHDCILADR